MRRKTKSISDNVREVLKTFCLFEHTYKKEKLAWYCHVILHDGGAYQSILLPTPLHWVCLPP